MCVNQASQPSNVRPWDRSQAVGIILCQTESEVVGLSGPWMIYCCIITIWVPTFLMRQCGGLWCCCYLSSHLDNPLALGLCNPEQHRAWREKMGLLSFILTLMAGVGFTEAVHGTLATRFHGVLSSRDSVSSIPIAIHGYSYDFKPLPQWDSMAIPIQLRRFESRSNDSLSKRSTSMALSQEPLVQLWLVQAIFSIGICPPTSIAV